MANEFVQTILNAETDAIAFTDFIYKPSGEMVDRRLAPPMNTLNYFLDYLRGLELVYSQESGVVDVNGVEVKTVTQSVTDAIDDVLLGEYQEGLRSDVNAQKLDTGITATALNPSALERTQADKNKDVVNLNDFKEIADGTTDVAPIIAIASMYCYANNKTLHISATPKGYYVGTGQTLAPCLIECDPNTLFKINNTTDNVVFNFGATEKLDQLVGFIGGIFQTQNPFAGTLFKTPKSSDLYFTYKVKYAFKDISIAGVNINSVGYSYCYLEGFENHIVLGDNVGSEIHNLVAFGDYNIKEPLANNNVSRSIVLDAASGILTCRMVGVTIGTIHTPIDVLNKAFYELSAFDIIGCYDGISELSSTTPYGEPRIFNGNINAQRYGIALKGNHTRSVSDVTIRRHRTGNKADTHNWAGIYLEDMSYVKLDKCLIQPDTGEGLFGGNCYGVHAKNCSLLSYDDMTMGSGMNAAYLLDNCTQVIGSKTSTTQNNLSNTIFKLTNNTRRAQLGYVTKTSGFSGDMLVTDGTASDYSYEDRSGVISNISAATRNNKTIQGLEFTEYHSATQKNNAIIDTTGSTLNYELLTFTSSGLSSYESRANTFKVSNLSTRNITPISSSIYNLGSSSLTFNNTYLQNSPIVSSDARLKQDFRNLKAAEKKAALEIKESICLYKMRASVAEKGDDARWHVGVKAQQIVGIMESHKLKPFDYGFICHDTWEAESESLDEDGNVDIPAREAGDKYAVRYDELAMFILAAI